VQYVPCDDRYGKPCAKGLVHKKTPGLVPGV
jgi:hypothetical protein